jgi:hypothetical protein
MTLTSDQAVTATFAVSPGKVAPTAPGTKGSIAAPPTLSSLSATASTWREGKALANITANRNRKKLPVGTIFSFVLNEQASVSLRFTQRVSGRKVGKSCVVNTNKNHKRKPCKRNVTAGTLAFIGHSGTNKVAFQGRISRSKKLKPGHYSLVITATNSAGSSAPKALSFAIVE